RLLFRLFIPSLDVFVVTTKYNMSLWSSVIKNITKPIRFEVIENTAGPLFESSNFLKKRELPLTIGFAGRYCDWKNWPLAVEIVEKVLELRASQKIRVKMCVGCLDG